MSKFCRFCITYQEHFYNASSILARDRESESSSGGSFKEMSLSHSGLANSVYQQLVDTLLSSAFKSMMEVVKIYSRISLSCPSPKLKLPTQLSSSVPIPAMSSSLTLTNVIMSCIQNSAVGIISNTVVLTMSPFCIYPSTDSPLSFASNIRCLS